MFRRLSQIYRNEFQAKINDVMCQAPRQECQDNCKTAAICSTAVSSSANQSSY